MTNVQHSNRFKRMRRYAEQQTVGQPKVAYRLVDQKTKQGRIKKGGEIRLGKCTRRYYKAMKKARRFQTPEQRL